MGSPFRAKHHVVVQYMARWMKCPLPLPPHPPPPSQPPTPEPPSPGLPLPPDPCGRQGGKGRICDIAGKGLRTAVVLSTASCPDSGTNTNSAAMMPNGEWDSVLCSRDVAYICECVRYKDIPGLHVSTNEGKHVSVIRGVMFGIEAFHKTAAFIHIVSVQPFLCSLQELCSEYSQNNKNKDFITLLSFNLLQILILKSNCLETCFSMTCFHCKL